MQTFVSSNARVALSPRDAGVRLLSRRPDLARDVGQQRLALELVGKVECLSAPVDVLAGVLGGDKGLTTSDLARLLNEGTEQQVKRLAEGPSARGPLGLGIEPTVFAAYELGWSGLDSPTVCEAVRCLALLATQPVPRVLITGLPGGFPGAVEDALWAGFASLDEEEDRLVLAPSLRRFIASRPESSDESRARACRVLAALRHGLANCDVEDEHYDEAADFGFSLALELKEHGVAAIVAHSMGERLRRRGWFGAARKWSSRLVELVESGQETAQAMRGPSLLGRGLLELEAGHYGLSRDLLIEAALEFEQGATAGQEGAHAFAAQTQVVLGEVLMELGERRAAEQALGDSTAALEGCKEHLEDIEKTAPDGEPAAIVALRRARIAALDLCLVQALRLSASQRLVRGETEQALAGLREAHRRWCELEGEQHPDGACFQLSLARALRSAGQDAEQDAPLEAARVLLGGDMDRVVQRVLPVALHDQAVLAGDRGEFEHAETLLVEAAMVAGGLVPESEPIHSQILYTRGLAYLARGETGRAETCFSEGMAAAARVETNSSSPQLNIQAARAWARTLEGEGHYDDAARDLEVAGRLLLVERGAEDTLVEHIKLLRGRLLS